jgi:hypothetical protein
MVTGRCCWVEDWVVCRVQAERVARATIRIAVFTGEFP